MVQKALVLSGIGVASAGGLGAWYFFKDNGSEETVTAISKRIEEQGERFILSTSGDTHSSQWDGLVSSYSSLISSNPHNKPLIEEFSNKAPTKEELKEWCDNNSKEDYSLKTKFDSFREWCTKDNISQHIKVTTTLNKISLALGDSEWENRKSSYINSATSENQITNGNGEAIAKESLKDVQTLQRWCLKNSKGLYIDDNNQIFKAYKEWCTKNSNG